MIGFVNAPRQNFFENDYGFFWFSQGMLCAEYKPIVVDKEVVSVMISARLTMCKGVTYPALVDGRKVKYWTRESRIYSFKHDQAVTNISAFAILNDSPMGNAVVNWVSRFIDTQVPVKLFADEMKALQWLEQYK